MAHFISTNEKTKHHSCEYCYWRITIEGRNYCTSKDDDKACKLCIPLDPRLLRCNDFRPIKEEVTE